MEQIEKKSLNAINKIETFQNIIQKLTVNQDLNDEEIAYILSSAILFLRQYERNKKYSSYLEISYYIILKYTFKYNNYEPLYDISINFGFYPIAKYIIENELVEQLKIEDLLININLDTFKNNGYTETYEQNVQRNNLLINQSNEQSYIAPTSYGKSSIIIEYLQKTNDKKIAIIVPTKSLLSQTYKLVREANFSKRIIIHDEMFDNDESFIAILTQERALRLLNKNNVYFDTLFIDEAHNIFDKSSRSILLSRMIKKNKLLNRKQKIIYLSPLIMDSDNLKLYDSQEIKEQRIHFNIKEPDIYEYRLDKKAYQYNRFVNEFYELKNYSNTLEYINENLQKKNFFYILSPKKIEYFSKYLNENNDYIVDKNLTSLSRTLEENVHKDFYCVDYVKKGFLYIHGQMPDLIKEYLEYKFKELDSLKYIIANTVILEGINFPIDTIFILNTYSLQAKELTNLIGRANRLNQIFVAESNNLHKLLPKIHFINSDTYNRKNSDMSIKIKLLRSRIFKDEIQNPTLKSFDFEKLRKQIQNSTSEKRKKQLIKELKNKVAIKNEEDFISKEADSKFEKIKKYLIEVGIYNMYNDGDMTVEHIIKMFRIIKRKQDRWSNFNMLDKIYHLFIKRIEQNISNFEFSRLSNQEARNFYETHIKNSHRYTLNKNIEETFKYFISKKETAKGKEFYIGKKYGEIPKSTVQYPNSNNNVYIDLTSKNDKELINLAIVKLKIEDDFIGFQLNKFITMMYDFDLISEDEYNLYIYGTTEKSKSSLRKIGLSGSLISRLEADGQIDNITIDELNNVHINGKFEKYKDSVDDFYRFQINKFL